MESLFWWHCLYTSGSLWSIFLNPITELGFLAASFPALFSCSWEIAFGDLASLPETHSLLSPLPILSDSWLRLTSMAIVSTFLRFLQRSGASTSFASDCIENSSFFWALSNTGLRSNNGHSILPMPSDRQQTYLIPFTPLLLPQLRADLV